MKRYNEIDSLNDRTRLVLLKYKQGKDAYDNRQLESQERFYTDNGLCENAIIDHLRYEDEFGHTKPEWAKLPHGFITTPQGILLM